MREFNNAAEALGTQHTHTHTHKFVNGGQGRSAQLGKDRAPLCLLLSTPAREDFPVPSRNWCLGTM